MSNKDDIIDFGAGGAAGDPGDTFVPNPAIASVREKFASYTALVEGVAYGRIRFLLAAGGPGLGKTFEATAALERCKQRISITVTRNAGRTTPLALYRDLFNNRTTRDVLVFDDCDDAFKNKDCLNILKAAADTRNPRVVSWSTSVKSRVPQRFDFAGRIIIITNRNVFDDVHLAPLVDRAHCFEMSLTRDERLERILSLLRAIARDDAVYFDVADWITRSADTLHALGRLTVRSAVKACELSRLRPGRWTELASLTLLNQQDDQ